MDRRLELIALSNFPLVEPGDDLEELIARSLCELDMQLQDGDILAIAQKIISKSENRYVYLNEVVPDERAILLAQEIEKDPSLTKLILDESSEVIRHRPGIIIVEHRNGYVHANAGIDQSNIHSDAENPRVLLLPENPDRSAASIREGMLAATGASIAVIINDSAGRAWRNGTIGFAVGTAGFEPVVDLVGHRDIFGRELQASEVAVADELAAAASFLMGQADEAVPVVLIRGANLPIVETGSTSLIRSRDQDMFR